MKIPFNPTDFSELEAKKKRVEKWSLVILLVGVAIEVPATAENLKDAADSRLKADELETRMQPREISTEKHDAFVNLLTNSLEKRPIWIMDSNPSRETDHFAFEIRKLLDDAGYGSTNWSMDTMPFNGASGSSSGMGIFTLFSANINSPSDATVLFMVNPADVPWNVPECVYDLSFAFTNIDIEVTGINATQVKEGNCIIFVTSKEGF